MSVIERRLLEKATAFVCGCSFIISGCPHHIHFYLLSYAMNAFHHISFHFFSFHFISFVFCHSHGKTLSSVPTRSRVCTVFKCVVSRVECAELLFISTVKSKFLLLLCYAALHRMHTEHFQATNAMVIFV